VPECARRRPSEDTPRCAGLAGRSVEPERTGGARRRSHRPFPERRRSQPPCPGELIEDPLPEPRDLRRRAEQSGVPGDPVHHPGVVVVDLAGARGLAGERLPPVLLTGRRRTRPERAGGREPVPASAAEGRAESTAPRREPVEWVATPGASRRSARARRRAAPRRPRPASPGEQKPHVAGTACAPGRTSRRRAGGGVHTSLRTVSRMEPGQSGRPELGPG
jgi:hypothetical protein